mmetsp:Transcript_5403/g.22395  ORF Transcript_5403/g.22395 Transcript_5403/m.22395 type:complete len:655 (-) Transcript_5403:117-2081(-)
MATDDIAIEEDTPPEKEDAEPDDVGAPQETAATEPEETAEPNTEETKVCPPATAPLGPRRVSSGPPWELEVVEEPPWVALGFAAAAEDAGADRATRTVVLYANERYNALARTYNSAALLPTDRRAFSTESGRPSWRDLDEAHADLCGKYWSIRADAETTTTTTTDGGDEKSCCDPPSGSSRATTLGDWEHAGDFTRKAFLGHRGKPNRLDFVRRRKVLSVAELWLPGATSSKPLACARVDPEAEARVGARLARAVAVASLLALGPSRGPSLSSSSSEAADAASSEASERLEADAVAILDALIDAVLAGDAVSANATRSGATDFAADVDAFVQSQYQRTRHLLGLSGGQPQVRTATAPTTALPYDFDDAAVERRSREIAAALRVASLPYVIRPIARQAVRRYDGGRRRGACDGDHSAGFPYGECAFKRVACPYCAAVVAARSAETHDARCDRKPVACPKCAAKGVERRRLPAHWARECPKRLVDCEFGCSVKVAADELAAHHDTAGPAHALMVLARARAAEQALQVHEDRIVDLETHVATALGLAQAADAKIARAQTAIAAAKASLEQMQLDHKQAERALAKSVKADLAMHSKETAAIQKALKRLDAAVQALSSAPSSSSSRGASGDLRRQQHREGVWDPSDAEEGSHGAAARGS